MRIGVDIDDTITNSWEYLIPFYSRVFNIPEKKLHQSKPYFAAVEHLISIDDFFAKIKSTYDHEVSQANIRENVKEVIDALYEQGHHIFFITARGKGFTDPYKITKEYLDKYHIKYDKIYTSTSNKAEVCQKENIDLFIDDSYKHCKEVSDLGIDVLMPNHYYNEEYTEFQHFDDWQEVYDYIINKGGGLKNE